LKSSLTMANLEFDNSGDNRESESWNPFDPS